MTSRDRYSNEAITMRGLGYVAGVIFFYCITVSCGRKSIEPTPSLVYFNSFESAEDTTGWQGVSEKVFVDDPAPGGGSRSLYIGGGCLQPAAYIDLPPQSEHGNYRVGCWGKAAKLPHMGRIVLLIVDEGGQPREIRLEVDSEDWRFYESEGSLHCPANHALRLEIWIGGFVPAYMFIDCIIIEKLK